MIVTWKGETWGEYGSSTAVERVQGLEDVVTNAANVAGGRDGAVAAPRFQGMGAWVLEMSVMADDAESMPDVLDPIRAVTWVPDDQITSDPFGFTVRGEDEKFIYAQVANRQIPTDFTTVDRYVHAALQIAYEATDPLVYGAEVPTDWELDDSVTVIGGWAPTERWRWIVHGPATNPRITVERDGHPDQIIRYVGTVADGQNLLVEATPDSLITTVGGFNRYGQFDGGVHTVPAAFDLALVAGDVVTYTGGVGSADGSFRYQPAMP